MAERVMIGVLPDLLALLRQTRLSRGWSRWQVAAALGVDASSISHWEHGRHCPAAVMLLAWCRVLGVGLWAVPEERGDV